MLDADIPITVIPRFEQTMARLGLGVVIKGEEGNEETFNDWMAAATEIMVEVDGVAIKAVDFKPAQLGMSAVIIAQLPHPLSFMTRWIETLSEGISSITVTVTITDGDGNTGKGEKTNIPVAHADL